MCKCPSVARGSWHLSSHSEVAISVVSVGTTSVAKSMKISMNFSSQRKFHEREASFDQNLERGSIMVRREEGNIPVYIGMNNEGEHGASESLTACWLHGRGQVTWPLIPEAHLCDGKRTRLTGS